MMRIEVGNYVAAIDVKRRSGELERALVSLVELRV